MPGSLAVRQLNLPGAAANEQRSDTSRLPAALTIDAMVRSRWDRSGSFALEANAVCARLALACAYSSSDEYEAEIIRIRRAAGAYGGRPLRQLIAAFATAAVAFAFAFFMI